MQKKIYALILRNMALEDQLNAIKQLGRIVEEEKECKHCHLLIQRIKHLEQDFKRQQIRENSFGVRSQMEIQAVGIYQSGVELEAPKRNLREIELLAINKKLEYECQFQKQQLLKLQQDIKELQTALIEINAKDSVIQQSYNRVLKSNYQTNNINQQLSQDVCRLTGEINILKNELYSSKQGISKQNEFHPQNKQQQDPTIHQQIVQKHKNQQELLKSEIVFLKQSLEQLEINIKENQGRIHQLLRQIQRLNENIRSFKEQEVNLRSYIINLRQNIQLSLNRLKGSVDYLMKKMHDFRKNDWFSEGMKQQLSKQLEMMSEELVRVEI